MTTLLGTVDRATGSVHLERVLPASPERVWAALTEPDRMAGWLGPVESGTAGPGRTFVLRMEPEATATCTVTAWEPPARLTLIWDYTGEARSEVSFALSDEDGKTRMVIDHVKVDVDPVEYAAGWHAYLDNLVQHLEGGPVTGFTATFEAMRTRYAAAAPTV